MKTVHQLLSNLFENGPAWASKLEQIKAASTDPVFYPFRTYEKVHLMSLVSDYFKDNDVQCMTDPPRVLDVGCADGDLSFMFEMNGCEVTAVDNQHSNNSRMAGVRHMKQALGSKVDIRDIDIDWDFSIDRQHDIVLFLDILYHLRNPMGALINLCRAGRFAFMTTRICEAARDADLRDIPLGYLQAPFESAPTDPTNYWTFTEAGFVRCLERSGWRVLDTKHFGYTGTDSNPYDPQKDKRVVVLCERLPNYEQLKYGYVAQ